MPQTHWGCIRDAVMRHEPVMALRCDPGKRRQKPFAYRRALRSRSRPYHRGTERCLAQSSFPAAFGGCVKPLVRGWTPLLPKNNCGDRGGREGAGTTGAHLWVAASPLAPRGGLSGARTSRWPGRRSVVPVRGFAQRYDCGGFTGGEATSPLRTTAGACARREVSGGSRH